MMSKTLTPISVPQVGARSKMFPMPVSIWVVAFAPALLASSWSLRPSSARNVATPTTAITRSTSMTAGTRSSATMGVFSSYFFLRALFGMSAIVLL